MSRENVEIVRLAQGRDGEDLVPDVREFLANVDWSDTEAIEATMAEDLVGRYLHPEIEWDASAGGLAGVAYGIRAMFAWWADWIEQWESYVYEVTERRDLGDWVLTRSDVRARGRGGVPVEMESWQLWKVRDGKIAVMRSFFSEAEALEAAGLREQVMSQENVEILRQAADAFNRRDKALWLSLNAPDVEFRADPNWPEAQNVHSREAVWEVLLQIVDTWEGATAEPVEIVPARASKVVAHYRHPVRAKMSGIVSEFDYSLVATFSEGLIVRHEWFSNREAAMQAAGLSK